MTNRLLTLAVVGAVGAGSVATVATAHQGRGKGHVKTAKAQIATVTSYSGGTLTLKTSNGTTVVGKVARSTRFSCLPLATTTPTPAPTPTPTATTPEDDYPTTNGARSRSGKQAERQGRGGGGWHDVEDDVVCDTSSLTAGTGVAAASTELSSTGQKFSRIVLVSGSSGGSDSDYVS